MNPKPHAGRGNKTKQQKKMNMIEIKKRAAEIAGCAWDDRAKIGNIADQLRAVAYAPVAGTDGDLSAEDREELLNLASLAESE